MTGSFRSPRRVLVRSGVLLVTAMVTLVATPAWADPPQPTNYRSRLLSVEPEIAGVDVEVVGGDAFVQMTVDPGLEVVVLGYGGGTSDPEPYLRFAPDGSVLVNLRSPAHYLNQDRYGSVAPPPDADPAAAPQWQLVGQGGMFSWHDHRIHWMSPQPPSRIAEHPDRPDVVFEWSVPFLVDGRAVEARGELLWLPSRSLLAPGVLAMAVLAGAVLLVATADRRRGMSRTRTGAAVTAVAALIGTVVSAGALLAPGGAATSAWTGLLLTVVALVLAVMVVRDRGRQPGRNLMVASGTLVIWGIQRWPVLTAPVLPTALPDALAWGGTVVASAAALGAVAGWRLGTRGGEAAANPGSGSLDEESI